MPTFREVPATNQSLYPTYSSTKEALEQARRLIPHISHNDFMKALLSYHNTLVEVINGQKS